jgi:hypothetical protein
MLQDLTTELLSSEYLKWINKCGMGRDSQGLRFGQYLCNRYYDRPFAKLFYEERVDRAYDLALADIRSKTG